LKRRQAGVMPRNQYEANSRALKAEAAALCISYDALQKRHQRAAKACPKPMSQVWHQHKDTCLSAGVTLGTPSLAAPPLVSSRRWSRCV
jgi:hypothetical protein